MTEPQDQKVGKPLKVCGDCYEALERYAAHLRNTLRAGKELFLAGDVDYPPAPTLCPTCHEKMRELRAIYIAKDDSGFRFGV